MVSTLSKHRRAERLEPCKHRQAHPPPNRTGKWHLLLWQPARRLHHTQKALLLTDRQTVIFPQGTSVQKYSIKHIFGAEKSLPGSTDFCHSARTPSPTDMHVDTILYRCKLTTRLWTVKQFWNRTDSLLLCVLFLDYKTVQCETQTHVFSC